MCGQAWTLAEAAVVCRQLKRGQALQAVTDDSSFRDADTDVIDTVTFTCDGSESSLMQCQQLTVISACVVCRLVISTCLSCRYL